jgi:hypothetical protein
MDCATYARTPGKLCYCYPLMDTAVIASLLAKKVMLDTKPEAQRLTIVCEQIYNGDWHDYYILCDLQLVSFGEKPSVFDLPLETTTVQYKRYIENVMTALSTLGITCAPNTSLKSKRKQIIKITPHHFKIQLLPWCNYFWRVCSPLLYHSGMPSVMHAAYAQ